MTEQTNKLQCASRVKEAGSTIDRTRPACSPGSFFTRRLAPWQMVSCAMLLANELPAAAWGAVGASSPYFCKKQKQQK